MTYTISIAFYSHLVRISYKTDQNVTTYLRKKIDSNRVRINCSLKKGYTLSGS